MKQPPGPDKGVEFLDTEINKQLEFVSPADTWDEADKVYENGFPAGESTGWASLDLHYTVEPGQLTIITGYPGSGKSEWLDALTLNLAAKGWHHMIFSPENRPVHFHTIKMIEKVSGKPFGKTPGAFLIERVKREDGRKIAYDLGKKFLFVQTRSGDAITVERLLSRITDRIKTLPEGKRGLVIDPYNELEHWRPPGMSETEYVSKALSMLRNWARENQVHVWLVVHPQKLPPIDGKRQIPTLSTASGSAHFWNKADNGICVNRDEKQLGPNNVQIIVQKIRFKHVGQIGSVMLHWDRVTGRYSEPFGGQFHAKG